MRRKSGLSSVFGIQDMCQKMRQRQKKNELISIVDPRGPDCTLFFESFNKLIVRVNTIDDKYLIDVHLKALGSYQNYLLRLLLSNKGKEKLTRELLSIKWLRWHLTKIYRKFQKFRKSYMASGVKIKS